MRATAAPRLGAEAPAPERTTPPAPPAPEVPLGRAIGELEPEACLALLEAHGVEVELVPEEEAEGVEVPIRLLGPVGGVAIGSRGRSRVHSILDCRLAVAILDWAVDLRAAGVVAIDHMSMYRPRARVRGTGSPSGHARGMALDVGAFHLEDGRTLVVEEVWTDRRHGAPPCEPGPDDGPDIALLRALVCAPADDETFQVVLTPHFDPAHRNHFHLELRPGVDWDFVR